MQPKLSSTNSRSSGTAIVYDLDHIEFRCRLSGFHTPFDFHKSLDKSNSIANHGTTYTFYLDFVLAGFRKSDGRHADAYGSIAERFADCNSSTGKVYENLFLRQEERK